MPAPMIDTLGTTHDVPDEHIDARLAQGWRPQTTADMLASANAAANEAAYGGVAGGIKAGAAALARGATLGLSDVAARALGGEDAAIALEGYRSENPGLSFAGELVGGVAPALVSGGAALPAGAAASLGRGVATAAGGGLRGALAAGAVEGGLAGVGLGASELALSDDPLTFEHAAATLGSNALFGAAGGAVVGAGFNAAERGLLRAKGAIDTALEKRAFAKAKTPIEAIETGDLSLVDDGILNAAERDEIARINAERAPQRAAFTDEIDKWRRANRDEHEIREISRGSDDADLREASGAFDRANIELRKALDNKIKFANEPMRSLDAVQRQGQALQEMRDAAQSYERRWRQDVADAPAKIKAALEEVSALGSHAPSPPAVGPSQRGPLAQPADPVRIEVKRVGSQRDGKFEALMPDGPVQLNRADLEKWAKDQIPPGWRTSGLQTWRDLSIERALPATYGDVADNALYVIRPSQVADRGIMGNKLHPDHLSDLRGPRREDLPPIDVKMTKDGRLWIEDGNHRLHVAAAKDEPVVMRIQAVEDNWTPQKGHHDISDRLRAELPSEPAAVKIPTVIEQPNKLSGAALLKARKKLAAHHGLGDEIGPFTEAGIEAATERVLKDRRLYQWGGAVKGGLDVPSIVSRIPRIEEMLAANQRLQSQLADLAKPPTSDLLTKIADARAVLSAPKQPKIGVGDVLGAVAPFAGPAGAAAAAGNHLLGRFRKLIGAATERVGKATSSFLGKAAQGAGATAPYAPVAATRVLAALRYGKDDDKEQPATLSALYKKRTDEIKQLTAYDETGTPRMRPGVRMALGDRLSPVSAADPILADRIETQKARGIEYLSSIIPRRPDLPGVSDSWGPSDMDMRSWARSAAAVEDPYGVLERAIHGAVTPEDSAVMRNVWPEMLAAFTGEVMQHADSLPYNRQLSLSILTGAPVTAALDKKVLRVLQQQFPEEPGSEGGTQAPKTQPQFGSMRSTADQMTPAQSRGANA